MPVAERSMKHRRNARQTDLLAAVAAARLASGRDAGDAGRSLAKWLLKVAARDDVPEDYKIEIEEASKKLARRSR